VRSVEEVLLVKDDVARQKRCDRVGRRDREQSKVSSAEDDRVSLHPDSLFCPPKMGDQLSPSCRFQLRQIL
jgi:hypothetical protein